MGLLDDDSSSMCFEDEQQVWDKLDEICKGDYPTIEHIDNALREFFVATSARGQNFSSIYDLARCSDILLSSSLFDDYVRRQLVHCLLEDEDSNLLLLVTIILFDVRENETMAELLNEEGSFPRLVDLIAEPKNSKDGILHRTLMDLLYEMSRIQRIKPHDLARVDDAFVGHLFALIEELSNDVNDPYHYPIIRLILVLNEQYMVAAHHPSMTGGSSLPFTNRIIKILASQGGHFKTFGENIILLLNRENETSLQLLTLKLLYLIFTTPATQEYFYTNDLRVLVDILIRNLLDLPSEAAALRHTYLRVLYPLLAHTQLKLPPHYKCEEIRRLLAVLAGTQRVQGTGHFEEADPVTTRLVTRCRTVIWLKDPETSEADIRAALDSKPPTSPIDVVSAERVRPAPPVPRKLRKRNPSKTSSGFLAPHLESARESALSVMEVAAQREKPGVMTPSRRASWRDAVSKKEKPLPPKTRRSTWSRRGRDMEPSPAEPSTGDEGSGISAEEVAQLEDSLEASAAASLPPEGKDQPPLSKRQPPLSKRAPPAPKARRWRGKRRKKEDGGGGVEKHSDLPKVSPVQTISMEKTLSGSETASPGASVAEALSSAQAEAMDGISEALERVRLSSMPAAEMKTVLTPPSPAPPRGVPGPTFSLERSPFIGEDEDD